MEKEPIQKSDEDRLKEKLSQLTLKELFNFIDVISERYPETFIEIQDILNEELKKRLSGSFEKEEL